MNDTPPEITTVLFIGGVLDRQRRQDKKIQYLKVAEPEPSPPISFDFSKPAKINLRLRLDLDASELTLRQKFQAIAKLLEYLANRISEEDDK